MIHLGLPKLVMDGPFLSQFQILGTLKRSSGTKTDTALPELLLLLEELEAFQQCYGNKKFSSLLHVSSNTILILFKFEAKTL